jgi:hypothetical protein
MLTKIASDQWQEDPESEIFIERDGSTLSYVLKYLRDGKVKLPTTETKSDVIEELVYYNIDHDANKIDDSNGHQANLFTTAQETINDLKSNGIPSHCSKIAIYCLVTYMQNRVLSVTNEGGGPILRDDELQVHISESSQREGATCYAHMNQLYNRHEMFNRAQVSLAIQERVGIHLHKVGLISPKSNTPPKEFLSIVHLLSASKKFLMLTCLCPPSLKEYKFTLGIRLKTNPLWIWMPSMR